MKNSCLVLFALLSFMSCQKDSEINLDLNLATLPDEVYEVYGTVLNSRSSIVLVSAITDTNQNCSDFYDFENRPRLITEEVLEESILLNKQSYELESEKLQSGGILVVDDEEIESAGSVLNLMNEKSAVGFIQFGRPIFYSDNTKAMFEMSFFCGGLCGNGNIVIAEKKENGWELSNEYLTWISK